MAAPGLRRLAAELNLNAPKQGTDRVYVDSATISSATNDAEVSGRAALCTVSWRGGEYPAVYPDDYTPVVGHVVFLLVQPPQPLVILFHPKIAA